MGTTSHGASTLTDPFFSALLSSSHEEVIRFPDRALSSVELTDAGIRIARAVASHQRIGVLTHARTETVVAVLGAMFAGVCVVPINPRAGTHELEHILTDSTPELVLTASGEALPGPLMDTPVLPFDTSELGSSPALQHQLLPEPDTESPALVMYTSGTTGPPKGAVLSRRALAFDLDALADAWNWSAADTLVHALPLHHVHGLVLGVLGPLRVGSRLRHTGSFEPASIATALNEGATMVFGVPTMYSRLADAATEDASVASALHGARLLVSGSAGLPRTVHEAIATHTGQVIIERYGMTETCITCAVPASAPRPGTVGPPLPGIELRLLDDRGEEVPPTDHHTMGEIVVRGPSIFSGYLGQPEATARLVQDGWVRTGDMARRDEAGYLEIVGRRSIDIIKSGGFKIGAGEIESIVLEHPSVAEVAVKGLPDEDLGERIGAWVVLRDGAVLDRKAP